MELQEELDRGDDDGPWIAIIRHNWFPVFIFMI
jgi:hypothetical protein